VTRDNSAQYNNQILRTGHIVRMMMSILLWDDSVLSAMKLTRTWEIARTRGDEGTDVDDIYNNQLDED
jgi:hypothetical protein